MLTPTQLQQLKEAIYLACPELKELTFGCRVQIQQYGSPTYSGVFIGVNYAGNPMVSWIPGDVRVEKKAFKIIGHPIQLHHVLQAIRKNIKSGWSYSVNEHGYISKTFDFVELHPTEIKWDLTKPFDEQEPEVHEWLHKLILGEEKT